MRAIVTSVLVLAAACGAAQRNAEALSDTVRSYNDGVRWERFSVAAVAIPPAERADFVDEMDERAKDLKISDYEIVKLDAKNEKLARAQIKLSWYLDSVGTVRETHTMQTWERRGKSWWIVDEVHVRGHEMPGISGARDAVAADKTDPAGE